jgi:hypothetical protein
MLMMYVLIGRRSYMYHTIPIPNSNFQDRNRKSEARNKQLIDADKTIWTQNLLFA